ncbi:MAG: UDP-N-acetylglucosamine 1-carboxyvinyltransferase [Planctomycetaceae bacterium]|nr:UDP-N-acetylglucosamine 1-carboxyvinyltransferase [Planctomycetaceae bacterium]
MDKLVIQGGLPLQGSVQISGAKNAALPIMAACLAIPGKTLLRSIPELRDITSMTGLLAQLGMSVSQGKAGEWLLESTDSQHSVADYELVRKMRASVCVLGPLLASRGEACVSLPGGCNIGHRPIDLHLKGLAALGAEIEIQSGYVIAKAAKLKGARIFLGGAMGSTVTGTCNIMSAAVLASGTTVIESAACEPEVVDLGNFLQACGAKIEGLGTPCITIDGVDNLSPTEYEIIPDRIEAATWIIAAAITRGDVTLENVVPEHLSAFLDKLTSLGVHCQVGTDSIRVSGVKKILAGDIVSLAYPGIPTDTQAQLTALLCLADGTSIVTDRVFPERFMYASELVRMGAKIRREANSVIIQGVNKLSGANVMASDLRASAALVIAALAAEGETTIRRIYHLDRGYENLTGKLTALGANVQRVSESSRKTTHSIPQPHWQQALLAKTPLDN